MSCNGHTPMKKAVGGIIPAAANPKAKVAAFLAAKSKANMAPKGATIAPLGGTATGLPQFKKGGKARGR